MKSRRSLVKLFSETVDKLSIFGCPSSEAEDSNGLLTDIISILKAILVSRKLKATTLLSKNVILNQLLLKILKMLLKIFLQKQSSFTYEMLRDCINDNLLNATFPDSLKLGNITPVHKKDETTDKENYRPVTILPFLTKIFVRLIYDQLNECLEQYLNSLLCGFRKAHYTQHALFRLLQERQNELDKSGLVEAILMHLSEAYDCFPHGLLIVRFETYGIGKSGLNFLLSCLLNQKHRTKVNSLYRDWYDIVRRIFIYLLINLFFIYS